MAWANETTRPRGIGISRPRGAKAAGLRYENELAEFVPGAKHGRWFHFQDSNGLGYCQPDLILDLFVLEAKYTWVPEGHSQLELLYLPVLEKAFGRRHFGIVVCHKLIVGMPRGLALARTLDEAKMLAKAGQRVVWHWTGSPAVKPRTRSRGAMKARAKPVDLAASGL